VWVGNSVWNFPHLPTTSRAGQFRGGLVFKAHRLVYHSTLGLRVTKKKSRAGQPAGQQTNTSVGR